MSGENYKQQAVIGEKHTRVYRVEIQNPYNGTPSIQFAEQDVITAENLAVEVHSGILETNFQPCALHQEIYNKVNELYLLLRNERDLNAQ